MMQRGLIVTWLFLVAGAPGTAQGPVDALGDSGPILRIEADGPTSTLTALAFNPVDGRTLYAAGWDKVVRVWVADAAGNFVLDPAATFRVPIGEGAHGAFNALAVSADGRWLAAGGFGVMRGGARAGTQGVLGDLTALTVQQQQDLGTIWVWDTQTRAARTLRGHTGPVVALAFAPPAQDQARDQPPPLVSAAREWNQKQALGQGAVWVWDVVGGVKRAGYPRDLPDPFRPQGLPRPGLAVWRTDEPTAPLRVAFAWGDGRWRLWEPERPRSVPAEIEDGAYNISLSIRAGQQLLTGSFPQPPERPAAWKGRLQLWDLAGQNAPRPDKSLALVGDEGKYYLPRALTLVASQAGGPLDHAVVVVLVVPEQTYELHVVDLRPETPARTLRLPLWRGFALPVLQAVPGGKYLAVAGHPDHAIQLYAVAALLQARPGQPPPQPQPLRGVGTTFRQVAFVRQGSARGLLLLPEGKKAPGQAPREPRSSDVIFDFSKGTQRAGGGWQKDDPVPERWEVRPRRDPKDQTLVALEIQQAGKEVSTIELRRDQTVTDYALLPPGPTSAPLLALAVHDPGVRALWLYHARTGRRLCQLAGHEGLVHSVAFSSDGRLLASTGEDQRVCLWSLTDPEADPQGATPPLISQCLPLATLFVTQTKAGDWSWLSWSPVGPYEAGSRAAERWAGWHANPSKPGAPPEFVPLAEHQKENLRPGILRQLVEKGKLDAALRALKEEQEELQREPTLLPLLEGAEPAETDGTVLLRQPPAALSVAIQDFPPERLTRLTWAITPDPTQAPPREMTPRKNGSEWTASASGTSWTRGMYQIEIVAYAPRPVPRQFVRKLTVRYQPPAPTLLLAAPLPAWTQLPGLVGQPTLLPPLPAAPLERLTVESATFQLQTVVLAQSKAAVEMRLQLNDNTGPWSERSALREPLRLQPGDNVVVIEARNKGALPGHEARETTRLAFGVAYASPVQMTLAVVPLPRAGKQGQPMPILPGQPVIVDVPRVRIQGHVAAQQALQAASWQRGDQGREIPIKGGQVLHLPLDEEFLLAPGPNPFQLRASTATRRAQTPLFTVRYHPPLPTLELHPPGQPLEWVDDAGKAPPVALTFQARLPAEPAPGLLGQLQTQLRLNGEILPQGAQLDPGKQTVTVRFQPLPGINTFQVGLRPPWESETWYPPVEVRYSRPPRILRFAAVPPKLRGITDFVAEVQSHRDLPLSSALVRAELRGSRLDERSITLTRLRTEGSLATWQVMLKNVTLNKGANDVQLRVSNAEGWAREAKTAPLVYEFPREKSVVRILQPAQADSSVREPTLILKFHITAPLPLERVELRRDDPSPSPFRQALDFTAVPRSPGGGHDLKVALHLLGAENTPTGERPPLKVGAQQPDAQGFYEVKANLGLVPGPNLFKLLARNESGAEDEAVLRVNYVRPPVELVFVSLQPASPGATPLRPELRLNEGGLVFPPVAQGQCRLRGEVRYHQKPARLLTHVTLYVNGLRQAREVPLQPSGPTLQTFEMPVELTSGAGNHVEVELPGGAQDVGNRRAFTVDCERPVPLRLRWHLILISPEAAQPAALLDSVLTALHAEQIDRLQKRFLLAGNEGRYYGPYVGKVELSAVNQTLHAIRKSLPAARPDGVADVVLFYYQGQVGGAGSDPYFWLSSQSPKDRVALQTLGEWFGDFTGAQLLLLDLHQSAVATAGPPPDLVGQAERWRIGLLGWTQPRVGVTAPQVLLAAVSAAWPESSTLAELTNAVRKQLPGETAKPPAAGQALFYLPRALGNLSLRPAR